MNMMPYVVDVECMRFLRLDTAMYVFLLHPTPYSGAGAGGARIALRLRRCPAQHQMPTLRLENTDVRPKGVKRIGLCFRLLPTLAQVQLASLRPEL